MADGGGPLRSPAMACPHDPLPRAIRIIEPAPDQHKAGKFKESKPIAQDRQEEALRLATLGLTKASIAKKLSLGEATVYRSLARARAKKQSKSQNQILI
jgi:DNA-binding CsgD family transcriptional regulator